MISSFNHRNPKHLLALTGTLFILLVIPITIAGVLKSRSGQGKAAGPTVIINPGNNIQAIVDANPEGTTFQLNAGAYLNQTVKPKSGDVFLGNHAAILDGMNTTLYAFVDGGQNVKVDGLIIRNYNSSLQFGAIDQQHRDPVASAWVISNNEFYGNAAYAVRVGDDVQVLNNNIHDNGQGGVGGVGQNVLVQGNTISSNNTRNIDQFWEAGGLKILNATNLTVRNNTVENNKGPGLWADGYVKGALFEGNVVRNNEGPGIFYEISVNAVIRNNTLSGNGFVYHTQLCCWNAFGGQILSSTSQNVEVYGNTMTAPWNGDGVGVIQQNRGYPWDGTSTAANATTMTDSSTHWTVNLWAGLKVTAGNSSGIIASNTGQILTLTGGWTGGTPTAPFTYAIGSAIVGYPVNVHNNSIIMQANSSGNQGGTGADADYPADKSTYYAGLTFDYNSYHVANLTDTYWEWGGHHSWSQFRTNDGQEAHGTVDTNMNPSTDTTPPTVSVTSPANGSALTSTSVTFAATATDPDDAVSKVEFYVDGALVNTDTTSPYGFTWTGTGGSHTVYAKAYDSASTANQGTSATVSFTVNTPLTTSFKADYFNNKTLSGTAVTSATVSGSKLNFNWSGTSPAAGVTANNWSAAYTGTFTFDAAKYRFNATADDGVRVFVDGTKIVDGWRDQASTTYNGVKTMTAGSHTVRVEYYQNLYNDSLLANWVHADTCYDLTGDGLVNIDDLNILANHFTERGAQTAPWDFDGDKLVSSLDMTRMAKQYGQSCS